MKITKSGLIKCRRHLGKSRFGPVRNVARWRAGMQVRGPNGRWRVGSFPPKARALHRTACQSLSNLRILTAPLLDCSDPVLAVPGLRPGLWRAFPPSYLKMLAQHRVLQT